MNEILIALLLLAAIAVQLVRTILGDGYGHRPPPRSHPEEWAATSASLDGRTLR